MKKILEVVLDDDGKMKFKSEYQYFIREEELNCSPRMQKQVIKKMDEIFMTAIEGFVDCLWKDNNHEIYPIVRVLSMAEMMSCVQPYQQAEDFWNNMMFHFIPRMEGFATKLKKKYGYDDSEVVRPMVFGDPSAFTSGSMPHERPDPDQFPFCVPSDCKFS